MGADLLQCPRCQGVGGYVAFATCAPRSGERRMDCDLCAATGKITRKVHGWLEIGSRHREDRVVRGESLREAAKRLGVSPADLSKMETGRADPAALLEGLI